MKYSITLGVCVPLCALLPLPVRGAEAVDFDRQIRPILADACFQCHGPDANERKAKLRLDLPEGAFADLGDVKVIEPGRPDLSELYARISEAEPARRMPPASAKVQLSPGQI